MADQSVPNQEAATASPAAVPAEDGRDKPEVKTDVTESPPLPSADETKEAKENDAPADVSANGDVKKESDDWQQRELALLKKIEELEKVKSVTSEDGLRLELKVREEEIDLLRSRVKGLETELQAALMKPAAGNQEVVRNIKQQHEELLSKARGMIFDKTKVVKNQELQIEALASQVQSLKDVNAITKDLLSIRNAEVKALEDRLQAMEARCAAERERHALVLQRAGAGSALAADLKREYETQLAIFKELREKYEQRVQALVSENQQLKDLRKAEAELRAK